MTQPEPSTPVVRFGIYDVDLQAGELRKGGVKIKLQEKPFQVLAILLEHPGEVVTREQLQQRLWPDVIVDFEHSLSTAIKKLRDALEDSADNPRFIETRPGRGYRFIYRVEAPEPAPVEAIAVLPLENLSGDPEDEYFVDGMTEALIAELGKVSALRVISRQSSMHYKGTDKLVAEIAQELNVDALVEGSVVRDGERVRISTQLIGARPERHLWAQSYERDVRGILALQGEVARAIAREIHIAVTPDEEGRLASARPVNPAAHEAYLKGRYFCNKRTPDGLMKGLEFFQLAVKTDPDYALAYARLADAYSLLGSTEYGVLPARQAMPRAKAAALRALEIDDTPAEAHTALGGVKHTFERDWPGAEREFKRAIELNPSHATAHHWYAWLLAATGQVDKGITRLTRARALDPLSLIINADLGYAFYLARQYEQAAEQLQRTLELDPHFVRAHYLLGRVYAQQGMYDEAVAESQQAASLSGGNSVYVAGLGLSYAIAGRRKEMIKVLNELRVQSKRTYVPAYSIALIYAARGEKERTFQWLEKAYEERCDFQGELKAAPEFDLLRSDPRFQALLRRMNFPN